MAVTITQQPPSLAFTGNPILTVFTSSQATLVYFLITLRDAATTAVINTLKVYPTPDNVSGSYVNAATLLDNFVRYGFASYGGTDVFTAFPENITRYYMEITEYYTTVGGEVVAGGTTTAATSRAIKGILDKLTYTAFVPGAYEITAGGPTVNFLTTRPNFARVNMSSELSLHYVLRSALSQRIYVQFFDAAGAVITTYDVPIPTANINTVMRINVSPAVLAVAATVDMNTVARYTVAIRNSGATVNLTDVRTYVVEPLPCGLDLLNVFFVNKFGAIDSYQFRNAEPIVEGDRTTVTYNDFKPLAGGYSSGGVYNPSEAVLDADVQMSYRANTAPLTDAENAWLASLNYSPRVWVQLPNKTYAPALVELQQTALTKGRYLQAPNQKQYTFKLNTGFTPDYKL